MVRAYATTLVPGPDGCARIDPEAALRWMRAAGDKWSLAGRDTSEQRGNLLTAMANLARKGDLDKREGAAAAHAAVDDPDGVAELLRLLREAGAQDQVTALLARDPAGHAALDIPVHVAFLLDTLRDAGAYEQVTILADRLPGEGLFDLFCDQGNNQALYRFGRDPDGSAARSWGWDDLN